MKKTLESQRYRQVCTISVIYVMILHRGRRKDILKLTSALKREKLLKRRNLRPLSSIYLRSLERVL